VRSKKSIAVLSRFHSEKPLTYTRLHAIPGRCPTSYRRFEHLLPSLRCRAPKRLLSGAITKVEADLVVVDEEPVSRALLYHLVEQIRLEEATMVRASIVLP
jgi:hypothetical protein